MFDNKMFIEKIKTSPCHYIIFIYIHMYTYVFDVLLLPKYNTHDTYMN